MGIYDDVANIKMIKEKTDNERVIYLGWSQGSTQMFYGLSKMEEEFYADSLIKAVMLAPCTILETQSFDYNIDGLFRYQDLGVYNINGPNWQENLPDLCS